MSLAFLDIYPSTRGHSLVIPKKHYEVLAEIPDAELKDTIAVAKKLAIAVCGAMDCKGFNILESNGKIAGQVVPHAHFHIIPRYENDGLTLGHRQGQYVEKELSQVHKEIKAKL